MCYLRQVDAAKQLYEEVFTIAPHVHEAYIEAGSLIAKTDPLGKLVKNRILRTNLL